jgi:hypothetical protein
MSAVGRSTIEKGECAVSRVHGKRAQATGGNAVDEVVLVGAVEVGQHRIERDVRRVLGRHDLQKRQVAIVAVHLEDVETESRARRAPIGCNARTRVGAYVDDAVCARSDG